LYARGSAVAVIVGIHGRRSAGRHRTGETQLGSGYARPADKWNAVRCFEVAGDLAGSVRWSQLVQNRPEAPPASTVGRRGILGPAHRATVQRGPIRVTVGTAGDQCL